MEISLFAQISLIVLVVVGLIFCVFGYKYAKFLMPLCGMLVIESIIYMLVSGYLKHTEFTEVLFYGSTAVASYIVLFFVMRLNGFFTGILGASMLSYFAVKAAGQAIPFVIPVVVTIILVTGLIGFVYKRVGVIISTSLFGAGLAVGLACFLIFASGYEAGYTFSGVVNSVAKSYSLYVLSAYAVLAAAGIYLQLRLTGKDQVVIKSIKITLESKSKVSI